MNGMRTGCLVLAALLSVCFGCQRADTSSGEVRAAGGAAQTGPLKHQAKVRLLDHSTAKGALDDASLDIAIFEVQANAPGTLRLRVRDPLSERDAEALRSASGLIQFSDYVQGSLELREGDAETPLRLAIHILHHRGVAQLRERAERVYGEAAGDAVAAALGDYDRREVVEVRCSWSRGSDVLQQSVHYRTEPAVRTTRALWTWGLQPSARELERGEDGCQLFDYAWGGSTEDLASVKVPLNASSMQCLVVELDYQ